MVRLIKEIEKYSTDESSNLELKLNEAVSEILKNELDNIKYGNKDLISHLKNDICSKNELKGRITFTFHQYLNLKTITEEEIKDYKDLMHKCYPIKYGNEYDYTNELSNIEKYMFKLAFDPYSLQDQKFLK